MNDENELEMSPLRLAAHQLHEMYVELRNAGFTKSEALTLVGKIVAGGIGEMTDGNDPS